jgi:hypothetical protein
VAESNVVARQIRNLRARPRHPARRRAARRRARNCIRTPRGVACVSAHRCRGSPQCRSIATASRPRRKTTKHAPRDTWIRWRPQTRRVTMLGGRSKRMRRCRPPSICPEAGCTASAFRMTGLRTSRCLPVHGRQRQPDPVSSDRAHRRTGPAPRARGCETLERIRCDVRVQVGADADLLGFDPDTIADRATYEQPHQFPTGDDYSRSVPSAVSNRCGASTRAATSTLASVSSNPVSRPTTPDAARVPFSDTTYSWDAVKSSLVATEVVHTTPAKFTGWDAARQRLQNEGWFLTNV